MVVQDKELRDSTDSQSDLLMEESRERIESEKSGVEIHRSTVESINADTDGSNLSCFRRFFFMILQHWSFDFCITLAILVNTLLLSLYYHDMPNSMLNDLGSHPSLSLLQAVGYIFTLSD